MSIKINYLQNLDYNHANEFYGKNTFSSLQLADCSRPREIN